MLERRSGAAVVELYALESALEEARTARERAERHVEAIERERHRVVGRRLSARQTLAIAQGQLAARLRALYEEGPVDPLEILLGADSVAEAIAGLDGLGFAVTHDREIVAQTARAKRELARLADRLVARRAAAERARAAAVARAEELEQTLAARRAYVERLARERRLRAAQITAIERQAEAAHARSGLFATGAPAPEATEASAEPLAAASEPAPSPPAAVPGGRARTLTVSASAYALPGTTATGLPVGWGVVAVDPAVIRLGTRMTIPGYGDGVAADVGPAIQGAEIDLWFPTVAEARAWGRRTVTITLH